MSEKTIKKDELSETRILRAVAQMPGGATIRTGINSPYRDREEGVTMQHVAEYLEALSEQLREHYQRWEADREELEALQRDLAGFRRIIHGSDE